MRIQLGQGSAGDVTRNMLKAEGVGAFYKVRFKDPVEVCDYLNYAVDLVVWYIVIYWHGVNFRVGYEILFFGSNLNKFQRQIFFLTLTLPLPSLPFDG